MYIKISQSNLPRWIKQGNTHYYEISLTDSSGTPTGVMYNLATIKQVGKISRITVRPKAELFTDYFWKCESLFKSSVADLNFAKKIVENFLNTEKIP